jgi:molybdopterin-containing oxidoreductase family iron-sulfur binding subunit
MYWRSMEELADTPEFRELMEREFAHALPSEEEATDPLTRRRFLKLMGASLALGGMAGCKGSPVWPARKILPYAHRPEDRIPGRAEHYATMIEIGGYARAILAKSQDGRPIKIEGNPDHPASKGAADVFSQASVLSLYDPDRSREILRRERGATTAKTFDEFLAAMKPELDALRAAQGAGLAILTEASSSPTLLEMRAQCAEAFPQMRWVEYEPISRDAQRAATRALFGAPLRPHLRLENADVIVSIDDDFLGSHPAAVAYSRAFAARRRGEGTMARLHSIETAYTITGGMADHRHALAPSAIARATWCLGSQLVQRGATLPPGMEYLTTTLEKAPRAEGELAFVAEMADDLLAHRGHSLITVGAGQPAAVQALGLALNAALGNFGTTMTFTGESDPDRPSHVEGIASLAQAMNGNLVKTLVILGGNPAFNAPGDVDFAAALERIPSSIHLSIDENETSRLSTWHVPRAHSLEAWADARTYDGTVTLAQPLIEPLFDGVSSLELLASLLQARKIEGLELVRQTWEQRFATIPVDGEWRRAVHDGFYAGSPATNVEASFATSSWIAKEADFAISPTKTEIVFLPDAKVYDGRFANNGWLQEFPDPMTKLTWDNAALVHPRTAREWGVGQADRLRIARGNRSIEIAVHLVPGQAPGTVGLALGYGRTAGGRLANGIGVDVYPLRTGDAMHFAADADIAKGTGHGKLATTQSHHAIFNEQQGRGEADRVPALLREGTLAEYQEHPDFAKHRVHEPPIFSLWQDHQYDKTHKWGMAIDLTACNGCGACVIACQAENNIPIVGKSEVARGREMHWIRVDRYFKGDEEAPEVRHQPVPCMQCETAPCEQVCPVAATTHSSEGLNDMVYNRCVGTRYCSNNCPYKVRRFNYFNNQTGSLELRKKRSEGVSALEAMVYNPDVTVRARGVMEKCTYCVQRIRAVTIPAKNEGRTVKDGEITPACAQTCPTEAIVFGDLNDPESRVRKLHENPRAYAMLAEINTRPRTHYLAKLTNPRNGGSAHGGAPAHGSEPTHSGETHGSQAHGAG